MKNIFKYPLFRILLSLLFATSTFITPAHAALTYFKDSFSNAINGQTPEQVDPINYISKSGYFYNISDFTYDNSSGLWNNGNLSAGVVLKSSSINQNYYCAGETVKRNSNDNHIYPAVQTNTTGNDGYVFNFDMNWDTGLIEELSIHKPSTGVNLFYSNSVPFDTSKIQHWIQGCNLNGTLSMYIDGDELTSIQDTTFTGGSAAFNLFKGISSHIVNWEITNGPTNSFSEFNSLYLNIPMLKQTDPLWKDQTYDSANKWASLHPTIEDWGCALTSATMVLQYYKIEKLPDGTHLNPGTLNVWLKSQPDGYVGNGLVNWLAISRLSKQAKSQNTNFSYDALEYKRRNGSDISLLTTDLTHNQPDILEEHGHFIVGKGISESAVSINDPYYNRTDLTQYNNTFLSLGRYIPSHTDLSYLMITMDPNFDINISNPSGQQAGGSVITPLTGIAESSYYLQSGIVNPNTNQTSSSIKILTIPTPVEGTYTITVSSANATSKKFSFVIYSYDVNGNAVTKTLEGVVKQGSPVSLSFPYQNGNHRGHLLCDPSELKGDNSTLHMLFCQVLQFFGQ